MIDNGVTCLGFFNDTLRSLNETLRIICEFNADFK